MRPVKASLRILGASLDPDEITRLLGVAPTTAGRKGSVIEGRTGNRERMTGVWALATERASTDGWAVEEVVAELLAAVPSDQHLWESIAERYTVDLFLGLFMSSDNQGFDISPDLLSQMAARRWRLSADVYGP
jgi:hypothetical protein